MHRQMKETYIAIVNTEDGIIREAYGCFDKCDFITKLNNDFSSCYYSWELIKYWKL